MHKNASIVSFNPDLRPVYHPTITLRNLSVLDSFQDQSKKVVKCLHMEILHLNIRFCHKSGCIKVLYLTVVYQPQQHGN